MPDTSLWGAYASLTLQAIIPIALGSFKSLKTPPAVVARRKKRRTPDSLLTEDEEEEEDEGIEETLTWADSLLFPVLGSVVLLSLWAIIKYLGKEWINRILGVYFTGAGMFALHSTFSTILNYIMRQTSYKPPVYHIRITQNLKQIFHLPLSLPSALLAPISIALPLLYIFLDRPWILSNLLASCLAVTTLSLLRLDSFFTAALLLGVLLIYDIFWVFATPVMVTVAKNIDAPIKLLAPKVGGIDFAMLGLGDVVVPGLMVALCLRFDLYLFSKRNPTVDVTPRSGFNKKYWWVAMASYVVGLGVTISVMQWFQAAQPALLYLSPACIIGPVLLALGTGELKEMWEYTDLPEESEKKRDETIEAGSEIAQKARAAAKEVGANVESAVKEALEGENGEKDEEKADVEDDSWMDNNGVVGSEADSKVRKRKGKKK